MGPRAGPVRRGFQDGVLYWRGIGVISAELADTGVVSAAVVEASPAYLEVARREVGTRYERFSNFKSPGACCSESTIYCGPQG